MIGRKHKRPLYGLAALLLLVAVVVPVLRNVRVQAYGLLTTRSIQLSSSAATGTDRTNVTYKVKFNTSTNNVTHQGIVVDFCSNSPIIGDSCTAPSNFTVGASPTYTAVTNSSGYTASSLNSGRTFVITNASASSLATNSTIEFDITGVSNPDVSNTTFYGRILTYDTPAHATAYTATASGGGTGTYDAGGVALSTAHQITITSKVQERLTFCVYLTGTNCASAGSGTSFNLGDINGVLDPAGAYVDKTTKYGIATNASQGAAIRIKGPTLTTGSFTISGIGASAQGSDPGNEQFGLCSYPSAGTGLSIVALYDGAQAYTVPSSATGTGCSNTTQSSGTATPGGGGGASFAFDTTNINTTYGQTFANKTAGSESQGTIAFIGNISNTTEAGIYTTTLTFIATGIF